LTTLTTTQLFPTLSGCWSNCVSYKRNSQRRYKYLVVGRDIFYFVNNHSDSTKELSETKIINMLEFFIENTFAMLSGRVFQQTVGIPMSTNCTPLLRDLFFYSYVWCRLVCVYTYEFWLSLCKIVRSSVNLLLPSYKGFSR
jgi:hypothetical protein